MLERFQDAALRAQIITEAEEAMNLRWGGAEGVFVKSNQQELTEIMAELGTDSAGEAVIRVLEEADSGSILRFGIEADLIEIMQHPSVSIACDCDAVLEGGRSTRVIGEPFPKCWANTCGKNRP